ncbi:MAG: hypothetical protein AB7O57_04280 [Hyphomicrobiaceae bacterium]
MADALTGRTARRQMALAEQAQADQRAELERQRRNLDLIEAGQRRIASGGGGGGLAFVDGTLANATLGGQTAPLGGQTAALVRR